MSESTSGAAKAAQTASEAEKAVTARDEGARLREIVRVLTKYNVPLCLAEQKHPERVREAFEELGPTFVKVGQILSVRTDIVSEAFAEEFKKLQDNVVSNDFSVIGPLIEKEAGVLLDALFSHIDEKPLASASIGQVHGAVLQNGQKVVVKIQHPGIFDEMRMDISLLEKAVPLVKHIPAAGMMDVGAAVAELKRSLMSELDFTLEADNIERFHKDNQDVAFIVTPKVYREYSTRSLLIMDFMQGMKISDYITRADEEIDKGNTYFAQSKKRLAREIVDNYMKQIFEDGYFHADPHPGNILIYGEPDKVMEADKAPPEQEDVFDGFSFDFVKDARRLGAFFEKQDFFELFGAAGTVTPQEAGPEKVVYIDFGMMGFLDDNTLDHFNRILAAFMEQDSAKIARAIMGLCKVKGQVDVDEFTSDVNRLFSQYYDLPISDISLPTLFGAISGLCSHYKLQLPQNVIMLFKGVGTIEGIVLSLDRDLSIMEAVEPYAKKYIKRQFDPKAELQEFLKNVYKSFKSAPEIPYKLKRVLDTLSRGEMKLSMEHKNLDDLFKRLEVMVNRLVMGLIIAALIIGSSTLIDASAGGDMKPISVVGVVGLIIAAGLAVLLVYQTYKRKR